MGDFDNYTLLRCTLWVLIALTVLFLILAALLIHKIYKHFKFSDKAQLLSVCSIFMSLTCKPAVLSIRRPLLVCSGLLSVLP